MRRWLFNIISVLSVLLFIATATLWLRSYHKNHETFEPLMGFATSERRYTAHAVEGAFQVSARENRRWPDDPAPGDYLEEEHTFYSYRDSFAWSTDNIPYRVCTISAAFKHLLFLSSIVPLCWIAVTGWSWQRRHRRRKNGLCASCGYDLRASRDRCPECGTPILPKGEPNP